jgi:hypothetical protein
MPDPIVIRIGKRLVYRYLDEAPPPAPPSPALFWLRELHELAKDVKSAVMSVVDIVKPRH